MGGLFFDEWSELTAQDVKTVPAHTKVSLHSSGTTIFRVKVHHHAPVLPGLSQKLLVTFFLLDNLMALLILAIFTELLLICAANNFCFLRWKCGNKMAKIAFKFATAASLDKRRIIVLISFFLSSFIFLQRKVRTTYSFNTRINEDWRHFLAKALL